MNSMTTLPITPTRLFDTCVFIDHLRDRNPVATRWILDAVSGIEPAAFSILTDAELWMGIRNQKEDKSHRVILSKMRRLPFIVPIARQAGVLYQAAKQSGHQLKTIDAIIAATAEYYSLPVYTNNVKDFKFISTIQVIPYS
jgi:tRNA(fMet)-specific endonuclease VapC